MNGLIKFLLDKQDMRAFLLRRYFVFVLVPMLNPDGVSRGHCRMDALNQNLNRYYSTPDP
jgi:cytosolic carboxypeptidase protein 5